MSYWANRQKQLNQAAEKEESKLKKRLSKYYDSEFRKLEKQIAAYYQEYGKNNVIEYRKLMEALSDEDKRLLIEQMDEFAKKYPQYAHLMPVRESIYKLNRLEGLQYSVIMRQAEIAGLDNDEITSHLNRLAAKGINYSMEALGFGKNFYSVNSDIIKRFVDVPWSNGENFSKRIWNDTQKLAQYLNQDIAQGIARGDSYDRLVRQLETFYEVLIIDYNELERELRKYGQFSVTFTCYPYEFLKSGQKTFSTISFNPYDLCKPIYKIVGEGNYTLTVNGKTITANVGQNLTIDSRNMIAYREDGTLMNTAISGRYEDLWLPHGDTSISISGGQLSIIPQWGYKP